MGLTAFASSDDVNTRDLFEVAYHLARQRRLKLPSNTPRPLCAFASGVPLSHAAKIGSCPLGFVVTRQKIRDPLPGGRSEGIHLQVISRSRSCGRMRRVSTLPAAVSHANSLAGGGAPFASKYSGSGEDRIHYVEAGLGPVVLFIHGFPSFWYCWRAQMEFLRKDWRVIAIDAPGAGLSAKPCGDGAYRVERLSERLDRLIEELAPGRRINLVGHDWGGALAWSYAKWRSDRLERLAVFSAPPFDLILELLATDPEQRARSDYMLRLRELKRETIEREDLAAALYEIAYGKAVADGAITPAEGELFREALAQPGALLGGAQWYADNIPVFSEIDLDRDAWPATGSMAQVPTMLVEGAKDSTFVERLAEAARGHASSLEVVTLDGVGHWTPFERPDAAHAALQRFLHKPGTAGA